MATHVMGAGVRGTQDRFRGPSLAAVSIIYAALFVGSLIVLGTMTSGAHFPRPDEPVGMAQSYFSRFGAATRISAFLVFASAFPLAVAVSTVTSKLQYLGVRA